VHFPRTDPAVIVLVEHPDHDGDGPRCLLGRSARFPERAFSTLAGFVEPGETLEQAVAREVFEESGIELDAFRYFGSQPWPFPASLMIGFHARARTTAIRLEDDEIVEARWFTPAELEDAGEWGSDAALRLPRHDSIARALIEDWRARVRSEA
jgi:NAD+ diphosphatase